jgi:hypothetical protein
VRHCIPQSRVRRLARKAADQPSVEYFLLEGTGGIAGVSRRGRKSVTGFCVLAEDLTLLDSLERMHHSGTSIAVASSDGTLAAGRAKGIVTREQLADKLAESIERYYDEP